MELVLTLAIIYVLWRMLMAFFSPKAESPVHWLSKEGQQFVSSGVRFAAKHSTVTLTTCDGRQLTFSSRTDLVTCKRCRKELRGARTM